MKVTRVYADDHGESHFGDVDLPMSSVTPTLDMQPILAGPLIAAKNVQFLLASPSAVTGGWHTAPRRQLVMFLRGSLGVKVSDGEVKHFGPTAPVFFEDLHGKGHSNIQLNDEEIWWVFVHLPD